VFIANVSISRFIVRGRVFKTHNSLHDYPSLSHIFSFYLSHKHSHTHTHTHTQTHTQSHTYTYTHKHTNTQTHTHAHISLTFHHFNSFHSFSLWDSRSFQFCFECMFVFIFSRNEGKNVRTSPGIEDYYYSSTQFLLNQRATHFSSMFVWL